MKGIPQELNKAIYASMCQYDSYFPKIDCILRKCDACSLDNFKEKLLVDNDEKLDDNCKRFFVKEWKTKTKENKESTQSYLHWDVHHCSYRDLINLYMKQIHAMSEHTFLASWNYVQFKKCRNN